MQRRILLPEPSDSGSVVKEAIRQRLSRQGSHQTAAQSSRKPSDSGSVVKEAIRQGLSRQGSHQTAAQSSKKPSDSGSVVKEAIRQRLNRQGSHQTAAQSSSKPSSRCADLMRLAAAVNGKRYPLERASEVFSSPRASAMCSQSSRFESQSELHLY
jgi:hypothetical protein